MFSSIDPSVIAVRNLHKTFAGRAALSGVSFEVKRGEMVALLGASGSGKSTLLRHLNGLHRADAGSESVVEVLGQRVQVAGRLKPGCRLTRRKVAMIFQQFNLVDRLSVETNVIAGAFHRLPVWRTLLGVFPKEERQRASGALARVGMGHCSGQRASTLSGGQQQRAAISRALVQGAEIILADEPIASLDPESARRVMQLLRDLSAQTGVTVLVSLHQVEQAFEYCPRTIALRHGVVVHDGPTRELDAGRLSRLYGDAPELHRPQVGADAGGPRDPGHWLRAA